MRSTIALLYVLAGPTGTCSFGIGGVRDFVPDQQCLRYDVFGRCDGEDSIWEVFHDPEQVLDKECACGECCVEICVANGCTYLVLLKVEE
mmetsp:Transcript_27725/g.40953  ORF Transcript_27725/g.40953 Transcript_27725/m.40953 type:complete len:90 (+) Transcript_27725:924-1193(+)